MKITKTKGKKWKHMIQGILGIADGLFRLLSFGNYWSDLQFNYVMKKFEIHENTNIKEEIKSANIRQFFAFAYALLFVFVLWIPTCCYIQHLTCLKMTTREIIKQLPNSFIGNWKHCK